MAERIPSELVSLLHHVELHKHGWWQHAQRQAIIAELWRQRPLATVDSLTEALDTELGIVFNQGALESHLAILEQERIAVPIGSGRYKLTEAAAREVEFGVEEHRALERRVRARYGECLERLCPEVASSTAFDELLHHFLVPLLSQIGVSTWDLLLTRDFSSQMAHVGIENLASYYQLDEATPLGEAVTVFLDPTNDDVRRYMLRLLTAYFFTQAAGVDQYLLDLVEKELHYRRLFLLLDSDICVALILGSADQTNAALDTSIVRALLDHGGEWEKDLYVGYPTLRELRDDLAMLRDIATGHVDQTRLPSPARERRQAALYSYMAAQGSNGLGAGLDFYEAQLELILSEIGARPLSRPTEQEVLASPQFRSILRSVSAYITTQTDGREKTEREWEHDLVLTHIVDTRRGPVAEAVLAAEWWLVTDDIELLAYDREQASAHHRLPLCIHPTALLQVLQFVSPRSLAWERSIVEILRYPAMVAALERQTEDTLFRILATQNYWEISGVVDRMGEGLLNEAVRQRIKLSADLHDQVERARNILAASAGRAPSVEAERIRNQGGQTGGGSSSQPVVDMSGIVFNVAHAVSGSVQQGGHHTSNTQTLTQEEKNDVSDLLALARIALRTEPLTDSAALADATEAIRAASEELANSSPRRPVIRQSLRTLRSVAQSAAGSALYAAIVDAVASLDF